jgi:hypothetical protein
VAVCNHRAGAHLESAPPIVVGSLVYLLTRRRRYSCSVCGEIIWSRRLRRRSNSRSNPSRRAGKDVKAFGFAAAILLALIFLTMLAVRNCDSRFTQQDYGTM